MPGKGLGGGEAACRVDRDIIARARERQIDEPCAGARQRGAGAREGRGHRGVEPVEHDASAGRPAAARQPAAPAAPRAARPPAPHRRSRSRRRCAPAARSNRASSTAAARPRAARGLRRLEADEAAQRRRDPHRAAGIGADRHRGEAVRDRDRRARGRAAGNARAVEGIAGRAVMRIDADAGEGEFGHVGAADQHRARRLEPRHDRGIARRRRRIVAAPSSPPACARPRRRTDP